MNLLVTTKVLHYMSGGLLVVLLNGCTSNPPIKMALTEMGTTSDSEYGVYGFRSMRSINTTGLGSEEVVGSLTSDPDKWSIKEQLARLSPIRNDLPDTMTPRLTAGTSILVERKFCKKDVSNGSCSKEDCNKTPKSDTCKGRVTLDELNELRDHIQNYQLKIASQAQLELKHEVLKLVLPLLSNDDQENVKQTLIPLQELYPQDKLESKEDVSKLISQIEIQVNTPINQEIEKIKTTIGKSGVFITNWQRDTAFSAKTDVENSQATLAKNRKVSGFLILGEPRITSLWLGDDLVTRKNQSANSNSDSLFNQKRNYLTYYQLRAKYVLFAENQKNSLQARLNLDLADIISKLQPVLAAKIDIKKLTEIKAKLDAYYAAITEISESGTLDASESTLTVYEFPIDRDRIQCSVKSELIRIGDTTPVISIRGTFDDFISNAK